MQGRAVGLDGRTETPSDLGQALRPCPDDDHHRRLEEGCQFGVDPAGPGRFHAAEASRIGKS
jgi:hypothetical protein